MPLTRFAGVTDATRHCDQRALTRRQKTTPERVANQTFPAGPNTAPVTGAMEDGMTRLRQGVPSV